MDKSELLSIQSELKELDLQLKRLEEPSTLEVDEEIDSVEFASECRLHLSKISDIVNRELSYIDECNNELENSSARLLSTGCESSEMLNKIYRKISEVSSKVDLNIDTSRLCVKNLNNYKTLEKQNMDVISTLKNNDISLNNALIDFSNKVLSLSKEIQMLQEDVNDFNDSLLEVSDDNKEYTKEQLKEINNKSEELCDELNKVKSVAQENKKFIKRLSDLFSK